MTTPPPSIDAFVRPFEQACSRDGRADLATFLPPPDDPLYSLALRELIRVDLELAWDRGEQPALLEYRRRFPAVFEQASFLGELAFEEYRLRCQAGESPSHEEYAERYGVDTSNWPPPAPPATHSMADAARTFQRAVGKDPDTAEASLAGWLESRRHAPEARVLEETHRRDPKAAGQLARALTNFPPVGSRFLGFELVAELGRGAFGRVYLARQDDLARRPVALKLAADLHGESQKLARLQHTHIVPIYSVHRLDPFHAVCMPFLGATTLADVLRDLRTRRSLPTSGRELVSMLRRPEKPAMPPPDTAASPELPRVFLAGKSYVEAVLWLGSCLADGLAHAHERGIVHRDLKPANVLLTDEGQPMLLDFNLSEEASQGHSASVALVGGTLPYMAPENLESFAGDAGPVDARGDVYALGVMLFQMLTGCHPFPVRTGVLEELLADMLDDRAGPPPLLRPLNPAVSPATEAVVRRCLEPDPNRRYASARQLREDLEAQLNDRPLRHTREPSWGERARKWGRRHPRLASSAGVGAVALVLLLALGFLFAARGRRLAEFEAERRVEQLQRDLRQTQFDLASQNAPGAGPRDEVRARCRAVIDNLRQTRHHRESLGDTAGDMLLLWARLEAQWALDGPPSGREEGLHRALELNQTAEACSVSERVPGAVWKQRADLLRRLEREPEADAAEAKAGRSPPSTARELASVAGDLAARGRHTEAVVQLREAVRKEPSFFWGWLDLGLCQEALGHDAEAVACFSTCIALAPDFASLYARRGAASLRLGQYARAIEDFDHALARSPDSPEVLVNRALARAGLGQYPTALSDIDRALDRESPSPRAFLIRSRLRALSGDQKGAKQDYDTGLRLKPRDEQGWLARGLARLAGNPDSALEDFETALTLNPRSMGALQNKAHVLAERMGQPIAALETLDQLLGFYPDAVSARAGRGVLLARLGRRSEAHRDAADCLRRDSRPATLYQVAGIFALTSTTHPDDRREALALLGLALRQGYGFDLLDRDRDMAPLRSDPNFCSLVEGIRAEQSISQHSPRPPRTP